MKVLLVEDDEDTRLLLAELLEEQFDVSTAPDGTAALELLDERTPDTVVTDESLPGIPGTKLAETVKRRWPNVRVVLVSGYSGLDHTSACDLVLKKPVDVDVLSKALEALSAARVH
jgi:DNA-binding response OmpR family regulator